MVKKSEIDEMLVLSERLDIPFITLSHYEIPPQIVGLVPERICRGFKAIPLCQIGPAITIAVADPLNVLMLDELRLVTGLEVHPVISTASEIMNAIQVYYSNTAGEITETSGAEAEEVQATEEQGVEISQEELDAIRQIELETEEKKEEADIHELTFLVETAPVVNTVNEVISKALKEAASDIHIEPFEDTLRIRYRVDGMLSEAHKLSKELQEGFIARLKIMSKLDITQRRLPQDGRFTTNFENRTIDFRVSVLPTNFGEKIVLRILDKGSMKLDLQSLGFSPYAFRVYQEAIQHPFGMVLITGPTGSGKSTTLYSMLSKLNTLDKNIVTIEDPIEYNLQGVTQIQIKPEIGLTFANALRSVLRQSPDIIMLGEIRDSETADIAMKASLTGHLVLSTLHTNDATSSIPRLMDMGIESFLISGSIIMASAQRLARKLCPQCKAKFVLSKDELARKIGLPVEQERCELYKPVGCSQCNKTGYSGRIAVAEALVVDEKVKQMIINRVASQDIKKYALESQGMKSLREDGLAKALAGETSLEEVIRVTAEF
jgi:type IV pilus assembly protein PilB